ncbi:hypothetical protein EPR50_G00092720 [Perca flavescens]|uniref:GHMP kinase N-terminal domain-containing protein n=1 Tax=Perca flavescens TaxID=8167 RepID=A0A484D5T6_PERFV|nr:hypothetical protein EPR50_G00092720 [Perca flavescens]
MAELQLCHGPDLLVRAARHYEGAGQVLLRQAVMSSQRFISIGQGEVPPLEEWQEVECPARLDLAGGWSDTPPIAFEHGGSVTNVAVRVDGKRPIGARARRIREPRLLLVSHAGGRDSGVSTETVCDSLDDLKDCCQPHAPGALLKAVCVCSGLVSLSSQHALGDQLMQRWGGGVELHSWSVLPTGSGLGTSSILAGALLAAVYRCTGRTYDTDSLIHGVLYLEQILTTGGGWQDQVGGLVGGVKVARSRPSLPLQVEVERLSPPHDFLLSLEEHLLLVYTGKTRLARNLLQLTMPGVSTKHGNSVLMSTIDVVPFAGIHWALWMAVSSMCWPTWDCGQMLFFSHSVNWMARSGVLVGSVRSREIDKFYQAVTY